MKSLLGSVFFILSLVVNLTGQDVQFTQFYQVPGQVNPALTGTFGGLYRIGINYRDQWRAATQSPYSSFSASGDVKFELNSGRTGKDIAAIGIMFLSDRTSIVDFNETGIALTAAYHKALDKKTKQYIGGGIQAGIFQKSLNYEDLLFGDQFNFIDAYDRATLENLPVNNFGNFDLNLGIHYSISPAKRTNFNIGASVYHILVKNQSFFEKNDSETGGLELEFNQYRRFNVHASYDFGYSETMSINPRILASFQGPHNQILLSNIFKFRALQDDTKQFFVGPGIRLSNDEIGFNAESAIIIAGLEYKGLILGLSYDHQLNDIFQTQKGLGIVEFSVNFLGEYVNENTFCPTF